MKSNKSILFAEDDENHQTIITSYLRGYPCSLEIVSNGLDAYEYAVTNSPDLIITDLQMPIMGGFDFIKKLRKFERIHKRDPASIVILSTDVMFLNEFQAKLFGVKNFIEKPIGRDKFINLINLRLQNDLVANFSYR